MRKRKDLSPSKLDIEEELLSSFENNEWETVSDLENQKNHSKGSL